MGGGGGGGGGGKGKGRAGLRLDGVRWVGVEEGVWEGEEGNREGWKRLVMGMGMGEGRLRRDLKVSFVGEMSGGGVERWVGN